MQLTTSHLVIEIDSVATRRFESELTLYLWGSKVLLSVKSMVSVPPASGRVPEAHNAHGLFTSTLVLSFTSPSPSCFVPQSLPSALVHHHHIGPLRLLSTYYLNNDPSCEIMRACTLGGRGPGPNALAQPRRNSSEMEMRGILPGLRIAVKSITLIFFSSASELHK
ncbi:hypothetical protein BS47DRAFT_1394978 [Hydnum rufescens UP504]|uniref:Uncharacterized protein n=1 Tax=Hydnum rufescens UP504 TaxID=1448309 RepID=A0A9P6ATG8_9AGAM|nr:hypothetical protein BS47DRAFT_1394978 [Hydnum rufescens UP504]